MLNEFALEVVGGKHDGVRGMYWMGDAEHPPPNYIVVGTCSGQGECGSGVLAACRQYAAGVRRANGGVGAPSQVRHPAYWTPDEDLPVDGEKYRLTHVRSEGDGKADVAVYVVAGVTRTDPALEAKREQPLTVPVEWSLPAPATALAKLLAQARELGPHVTSGQRSLEERRVIAGSSLHVNCRGWFPPEGWVW